MNLHLLLLADGLPSPSGVGDWLKVLAGGVVALLSMTGMATFFVRGFWVKNVEPMFLASLRAWHAEEAQVLARREEIRRTVNEWYHSPDSVRERNEFQTANLDNQIRRDDGLINREIHAKVRTSAETLEELIGEQQRRMDVRDQRDTEFQTTVLNTLKDLQQSVSFLQGQLSHVDSSQVSGRRPPPPLNLTGKKT